MIGRLEKAKLPDLKQDMLMVFIRLINTQYDTKLLFDFLTGISVAGTDGLTYLIQNRFFFFRPPRLPHLLLFIFHNPFPLT